MNTPAQSELLLRIRANRKRGFKILTKISDKQKQISNLKKQVDDLIAFEHRLKIQSEYLHEQYQISKYLNCDCYMKQLILTAKNGNGEQN